MASDNRLMYVLLLFFIVLGVAMPYYQSMFDQTIIENDMTGLKDATTNDEGATAVTILSSVFGIFKISFWTFGTIPLWIDLIVLLPLRLMFWYLVYKGLRGN